jgi:hypothetical protein
MSGIEVDTAQQRNATQDIEERPASGTLVEVSNHVGRITAISAEKGRMASDARDDAVDQSQHAEILKREILGFIASVRAS